jgi:glyoxylase-like metal-dependent hydrolase (beta-lactamase superfamily II)
MKLASIPRLLRYLSSLALLLGVTASLQAQIDFQREDAAPGNLRFAWINGSISAKANTDVRVQVHRYNEHTYILRQNPAVHWEAPFMYLLFGNDRAVLLDAGATAETEYFPLAEVVEAVITRWLSANDKDSLPLLVVPTGDDFSQTQALRQFANRPNTQIVEPTLSSRQSMLGFENWPDENSSLDLGGRTLTLVPTPGLNENAFSVYDPWSDLLLTGNTLYAGRLVIRDFEAYRASLRRLLELEAAEPIAWVMGGRIEMTAHPGMDYRLRANYRPLEHALQLPAVSLHEAYQIVQLMNAREDIRIHDDFIVMHGVGRGARDYGWPVFIPEQFREVRVR